MNWSQERLHNLCRLSEKSEIDSGFGLITPGRGSRIMSNVFSANVCVLVRMSFTMEQPFRYPAPREPSVQLFTGLSHADGCFLTTQLRRMKILRFKACHKLGQIVTFFHSDNALNVRLNGKYIFSGECSLPSIFQV